MLSDDIELLDAWHPLWSHLRLETIVTEANCFQISGKFPHCQFRTRPIYKVRLRVRNTPG